MKREHRPQSTAARIGQDWLPPIGLFLFLVVIWQSATMLFEIKSYLLPSPIEVLQAGISDAEALLRSTLVTAQAALCGFGLSLLVGCSASACFAQFPLVRRGVLPYAILLQTVPMIAIAPLILNWLGPGQQSVIVISLIVSLFPIITNATAGLLAVPSEMRDLFQLHQTTRWQTMFKLNVPHAVPYIVTGARISAGLAVLGAIVGEFFAGNFSGSQGLGFVIPQRISHLRTAEGFAAVALSTMLGLLIYGLVGLVRNTVLRPWCQPEDR
jgi:NitT/TauT family transport system permease protein